MLGHYARDEQVFPLAEAIHRMSGLTAATLGLRERGLLREGYFADVVVFDPAAVADLATFTDPHRLPAGVSEVLVNGQVTVSVVLARWWPGPGPVPLRRGWLPGQRRAVPGGRGRR